MKLKFLAAIAAATVVAGPAMAEYPEKDLEGVIQWGAGGSTDTVARAIGPLAEENLGVEIVMTNRPGATGAIATAYVNRKDSDGYTLLFGAENPQVHKVLGLSKIDYGDFYPVNILARGVAVIVTQADAPWNSVKELVEDAKSRPGAIKMATTGPGGLPHVVGSMLKTITQLDVAEVPFQGDGPGLTALQGGAVDFMPAVYGAAEQHIQAGRLKALALVDTAPIDAAPEIAPITADYPEFEKYLPWGPFFGVWVNRETPEEATSKLVSAFASAAEQQTFTELLANRGFVLMNISGEEADKFLKNWQSVTSWLLHDAGAAKMSPEEFDIPRP